MSEPILTQHPITIDLSQDAMRFIVDHMFRPVVRILPKQANIEVENFLNLLENLLERGAGKITVSNNEDLL